MTVADAYQLLGMRYRQILEQRGMNESKDRSVGADSQTERHQRRDSESGMLAQLPCCVVNVANQCFQKGQPPRPPIMLPRLRHTTEGTQRLPACFLFRHAAFSVLFG